MSVEDQLGVFQEEADRLKGRLDVVEAIIQGLEQLAGLDGAERQPPARRASPARTKTTRRKPPAVDQRLAAETRILDVLRKAGRPLPPREVVQAVGVSIQHARKIVHKLAARGLVRQAGKTNKRTWEAVTDGPATEDDPSDRGDL